MAKYLYPKASWLHVPQLLLVSWELHHSKECCHWDFPTYVHSLHLKELKHLFWTCTCCFPLSSLQIWSCVPFWQTTWPDTWNVCPTSSLGVCLFIFIGIFNTSKGSLLQLILMGFQLSSPLIYSPWSFMTFLYFQLFYWSLSFCYSHISYPFSLLILSQFESSSYVITSSSHWNFECVASHHPRMFQKYP